MDDLIRLLNAYCSEPADNDKVIAVATVVNARGSVYRRPGARMIIRASGKVEGAVSAGCLERDIIAHSSDLLRPVLLTYDGNSGDDLIFGLKLGCDGVVQILLEPANQASLYATRAVALKNILTQLFAEQKTIASLNIFSVVQVGTEQIGLERQTNIALGTALIASRDRSFILPTDSEFPGDILETMSAAVQTVLSSPCPQSTVWSESIDGWKITALIEIVEPLTSLILFGSGEDVDLTARFARLLGWQVEIIDERKTDTAILSGIHACAAVIATHDYERDKKILAALFSGNISYVGVIGPRLRADKLLAELALGGLPITEQQVSRFYSPVGLDIGAERPEEIALSIVAEIKTILSGHSGGMLRHKQNGIHQKSATGAVGAPATLLPDGLRISPACNPAGNSAGNPPGN